MVNEQPNSHLVRDLRVESQYLALLHRQFRRTFMFNDSKIISIYETIDTKTVRVSSFTSRFLISALKELENTWHR